MNANREQLKSIQYLRALAALMIVLHHAKTQHDWLYNPIEGYHAFAWGADIFFVISGFIMYVAARNENHVDFLGRRIIRVVPLYWGATFALLAINTHFHIWWINSEDFSHLIKSLFFIPDYSPYHPDRLWPYLIQGWTLNYEMLFYLIFFIGLMLKRTLIVSNIAIFFLFFLGILIEPQGAILKAYTKPILLEFLLGIWIAYAYLKGLLNKYLSALIFLGFLGLFMLPFIHGKYVNMPGRIICSSMIIIGTVSLNNRTPHNRLFNLLGDASYSIYLTHTVFSLRLSSLIWQQVPVEGWLQFTVWVIFSLALSSAVGIIVYLYFEKPILNLLREKWKVVAINKFSRKMVKG